MRGILRPGFIKHKTINNIFYLHTSFSLFYVEKFHCTQNGLKLYINESPKQTLYVYYFRTP